MLVSWSSTPGLKVVLLDVSSKTTFKPGVLDQLTSICGKNTSRLKSFLDIAGSSFTRYIKA